MDSPPVGLPPARPAIILFGGQELQPKRSIIDGAFSRKFGIVPLPAITIQAAVDKLWQALNDTPTSTPTACQPQYGCLPLTAHQFLHHVWSPGAQDFADAVNRVRAIP